MSWNQCQCIMSDNGFLISSMCDSKESFLVWLKSQGFDKSTTDLFQRHSMDWLSFRLLNEDDIREMGVYQIGVRKRIMFLVNRVRGTCDPFSHWNESPYKIRGAMESSLNILDNQLAGLANGGEYVDGSVSTGDDDDASSSETFTATKKFPPSRLVTGVLSNELGRSNFSSKPRKRIRQRQRLFSTCEEDVKLWKVALSATYAFLSLGLTSFVMVLAHERLPEMSKYPPLPDILLENLPYIPWAFKAAEVVCMILCFIWFLMVLFHRHRFIIIRRYCSLIGTVFLLRSVTMFITSLSVPGQHLLDQCKPFVFHSFKERFSRASEILLGMGMSLQGVRTCGDYMFSGHTTVITMLNFFITEYTPPSFQLLHTFTWILNIFGVFFILAAHEHYSIDVFMAMYITSRLFLYYHWSANNYFLMCRDQNRARISFPMFSFFESDVRGVVPPEFSDPFECTSFRIQRRLSSVKRIAKLAIFVKMWQQLNNISAIRNFQHRHFHEKIN